MLKEQVFNILETNYSKIIFDNDIVSYKTILESDIHPSIKNYIKSELKILFSRDKALIKKKSVFNYSSVKTDFLFHQIFDELIKSTFISSEEVNNLLLQAISFNLSHLIKPNWSLKKLIFNDKKNISSNDFFYLIEYAYFYPYQKNIVIKYFKKFDKNLIESEKFEEILKKIDLLLFKEHRKEILLDFHTTALNYTNSSLTNCLQSEVILSFLLDKGLTEDYKKIKQYFDAKKKYELSKTEFEEVLFQIDKVPLESETIQEQPAFTLFKDEDELKDSNLNEEKAEIENVDNKIQLEDNSDKNENFTLFDEELEEFSLHLESETDLEKKFELHPQQNDTHNKNYDLASEFLKYLTEKEIQKIQENIFNSDSDDFISFIENLVIAKSYEDSTIILNKMADDYHIDQSSKEILLLKNALEKFFNG